MSDLTKKQTEVPEAKVPQMPFDDAFRRIPSAAPQHKVAKKATKK
jgi:hypothetical protein